MRDPNKQQLRLYAVPSEGLDHSYAAEAAGGDEGGGEEAAAEE